MLDEIELFVGAGGPEVLAVIHQIFFLLLALLIGEGECRLLAEGRVGQDIIEPLAGVGEQCISQRDGNLAVQIADVVEIEVHQAHLEGTGNNFPAPEGFPL